MSATSRASELDDADLRRRGVDTFRPTAVSPHHSAYRLAPNP